MNTKLLKLAAALIAAAVCLPSASSAQPAPVSKADLTVVEKSAEAGVKALVAAEGKINEAALENNLKAGGNKVNLVAQQLTKNPDRLTYAAENPPWFVFKNAPVTENTPTYTIEEDLKIASKVPLKEFDGMLFETDISKAANEEIKEYLKGYTGLSEINLSNSFAYYAVYKIDTTKIPCKTIYTGIAPYSHNVVLLNPAEGSILFLLRAKALYHFGNETILLEYNPKLNSLHVHAFTIPYEEKRSIVCQDKKYKPTSMSFFEFKALNEKEGIDLMDVWERVFVPSRYKTGIQGSDNITHIKKIN